MSWEVGVREETERKERERGVVEKVRHYRRERVAVEEEEDVVNGRQRESGTG